MDVLAFPLRFNADGRAETVEQGSDVHCAQQISQFVQTRPRELPLALGYGIEDPAFNSLNISELTIGISLYHPGVVVEDVLMDSQMDGKYSLNIKFSANPTGYINGLAGLTSGAVLNA